MNDNGELLKLAESFATKAHSKQKRKNGDDYKTHLLNVVTILQSEDSKIFVDMIKGKEQKMLAIAWLHDVVEDTEVTIDDIKERFGEEIADCIRLLTRPRNLSYAGYGDRLINSENLLAIIVKYADLHNNLMQIGDGAFSEKEETILEERWTDLFDKIGEYLRQKRSEINDTISIQTVHDNDSK